MLQWQMAIHNQAFGKAIDLMTSDQFDPNSVASRSNFVINDKKSPLAFLNTYSSDLSKENQKKVDELKLKIINHPEFNADYQFFQGSLPFSEVANLMEYGVSMPKAISVLTARTNGNRFSIEGKVKFPEFNYGEYQKFTVNDFKENKPVESSKEFTLSGNQHALGHLSLAHSFDNFMKGKWQLQIADEKTKHAAQQTSEALTFEANLSSYYYPSAKTLFEQYKLEKPVLIDSGWKDHSVYFVLNHDMLYQCDNGIVAYKIGNPSKINEKLISDLTTNAKSSFITELPKLLSLEEQFRVTEPQQQSSNNAWKSEQVAIKALLHANLMNEGYGSKQALDIATKTYTDFVKYDLDSAVENIVFNQADLVETQFYDTLLLEILKADLSHKQPGFEKRATCILSEIKGSDVLQDFMLPEPSNNYLNKWLPESVNKAIDATTCLIKSLGSDESCMAGYNTFFLQQSINGILAKQASFNENTCNLTGEAELIEPYLKNYPILTNRIDVHSALEPAMANQEVIA